MRTNLFTVVAICLAGTAIASADLVSEFAGFSSVWETGVSGLTSSYYADTIAGLPVTGPTTGSFAPAFGPSRVDYPGVGEFPSPGGEVGTHFDQGVLGVKVGGGNLTIQLASGLDPVAGYYSSGWNTWYGQGDLFLAVSDSAGLSHFALLDTWARDEQGVPRELNGGHFAAAKTFHVSGGAGGSSLEGHLVRLGENADVTLTGGTGSYNAGNAPTGLDIRAFAQGGLDRGDAGLIQASLTDLGQTWYVQTWTIPLSSLSADGTFDVGLHATASCGNDQIGGGFSVPEPASVLLALSGLLIFRGRRWD